MVTYLFFKNEPFFNMRRDETCDGCWRGEIGLEEVRKARRRVCEEE